MMIVVYWNFYLQFWIIFNLLWTLTQHNDCFYYSGYGSSSTFSQMDREQSSKTSAKALYGMFNFFIQV